MEKEAHVRYNDVIDVSEEFAGWMVSKFSWPKGIEATDSTKESALLGKFFVDKGSNWSQSDKPSPLDKVHFVGINI